MTQDFDVFLSYNTKDRAAALALAGSLEERGLRPWIDEKYIRPGSSFLQEIAKGLEQSRSAAVLIGRDGLGPWQAPEVELLLTRSFESGLTVIPVLLSEAPENPDLPPFLRLKSRVDLRGELAFQGLERLISGIRGGPAEPSSRLPAADLPVLRNLPFESLESHFKGRGTILAWLATELAPERAAKRVLIRGLGGIGKTRLAIEYAWRYGSRYIALLFVPAESPESLQSKFAALAGPSLLNLPEREGKELELVGAVKRWLRDHPGWLMILDGIDTQLAADAACDLLPSLIGGQVLLTSRILDWPPNVLEQELFPIAPEEAVRFLLERTQETREATPEDAAWAADLANTLDSLPLALEQAAAYITHHRMSLAEYLEAWRRELPEVLKWRSRRASQVEDSVAVTWQKSFQELGPVASAILRLAAHLAPEPVPISMLVEGSRVIHEAAVFLARGPIEDLNAADVKAALVDLATYSLVTWRGREILIHRVVQEVLRSQIPLDQRLPWVELTLRLVDSYLPFEKDSLERWPDWDLLRPHATQALEYADRYEILEPTAKLCNRLGYLLNARGLYAEAESLYRRSLEIALAARGPEDRVVAIELNNLAGVLVATGRASEAEPLYRRALQIDEKVLGTDDLEVAVDLNNLAIALQGLDRPGEATGLLRRALQLFESQLDPEAPQAREVREHLRNWSGDRKRREAPHLETRREQPTTGPSGAFTFSLKIEPLHGDEYPVFVIDSPVGTHRGRLGVSSSSELEELLEQVMTLLGGGHAARGAEARQAWEQAGDLLFRALFQRPVFELFQRSLGSSMAAGESLTVRLHFDSDHPQLALLTSIPWELLYWREKREFLSLGRRTPFVRSLDVPRPASLFHLTTTMRVLVVSAQPASLAFLEAEREGRSIEESLRGVPGVSVQILHRATPEALRRTLLEQDFHVLHFVGHGVFDSEHGEGCLVFEDAVGRPALIAGAVVAHLLRDFPSLRLVFLNTCGGARHGRREGIDPFAGVAASLVMAGTPAVLAMQFDISDAAAVAFSQAFYRRLAAGDPIDVATVEGRMAILLKDWDSVEWATPVLYMRGTGALFTFREAAPSVARDAEISRHIIDFGRYLQAKTAGFVGRHWLFDVIGRFVAENPRGYLLLRGAPGVGRSTFLAELVRRTRAPHHFNIRAEGINRASQFLASISAQLILRYGLDYPALPPEATQDGRFFGNLLSQVSAKLAPGEKVILMIDALDEADSSSLAPGANALYLPVTLPPGVYIIATSRRGPLSLRVACEEEIVELGQDSEGNLADLREYVWQQLQGPGIRSYLFAQSLSDTEFVDTMVARSEGSFIYLRYVLAEIERGAYQKWGVGALPIGLRNFYEDQWQRMRARDERLWFEYQLPILATLTVTRKPISIDLIAEFSGISDRRRIRAVLSEWEDFLATVETEVEGRREKRYRLYHLSFCEFIAAKDEVADEHVDLKAAQGRIADLLWKELAPGEG